jgi:hypothetical protein
MAYHAVLRVLVVVLHQVVAPHEAEFLSYYLILSCSTFGSFRASTANVVRLLNQMSTDVMVSRAGGGEATGEETGGVGCMMRGFSQASNLHYGVHARLRWQGQQHAASIVSAHLERRQPYMTCLLLPSCAKQLSMHNCCGICCCRRPLMSSLRWR